MTSLPGPGSITDVPGVRVGHAQRIGRGWRTGTTVVFVPGGAVAGVDVRGGGPGTRETDALHPQNLVDTVHAVCLSGGSAYGLSAADGVQRWLEQRHLGVRVGPEPWAVVPVVPSAVIFDLGRAGSFANRPDAAFGQRAISAARRHPPGRGAVGAGSGAIAGRLQGGVGTASMVVGDIVVGALAVVNAAGAVIDPATGLPWEATGHGLRRPSSVERNLLAEATSLPAPSPLNTTIGVVATSARLSKAEAGKLASVCHDGLARCVRPAHSMFDGDTVFALATGQHELPGTGTAFRDTTSRPASFNQVLDAASRAFAAACTDAIVCARGVGGPPAFRDLCPSAFLAWPTDG